MEAEYRRFSNTAEAVLGVLERLKGPVAVALEATLHWARLHHLLSGTGDEVKVAHPQHASESTKHRLYQRLRV